MSTSLNETQTLVVDSMPALVSLLDSISNLPNEPPSFYIDLEGVKLGRHGTVSIISMYVAPAKTVYLIDVHTLGKSTFSTTNDAKSSLKDFFESSKIRKVFFDIRNDSDALFSLYQISVAGIEDLQLMELAYRSGRKDFVSGLAKCIEKEGALSKEARAEWQRNKHDTTHMFDPKKGGQYEVFNERPLKPEISKYCAQDVVLLPKLYDVYSTILQAFWRSEVQEATKERIKASQSATYDPQGPDRARGPWTAEYIVAARDSWNEEVLGRYIHEKDAFYTGW